MITSHSRAITHFMDDDAGFLDWIEANPDGYFVNTERNPKPNYLVLHRSSCPHLKGGSDLHWTKDYVKFCSTDSGELEEWAARSVGGGPTLCHSCFRQPGSRP